MKTTKEIRDIETQISILHAKKEFLESELLKTTDSTVLSSLLPKCKFFIMDYFVLQVFHKDEQLENEISKLALQLSNGWNHFSIPLDKQINFRVDNGEFLIQFDPDSTESVSLSNKEYDKKYQFERIVEFLKSKGVKQEQISVARLKENIKQATKNLDEAITDLKFVEETLAK